MPATGVAQLGLPYPGPHLHGTPAINEFEFADEQFFEQELRQQQVLESQYASDTMTVPVIWDPGKAKPLKDHMTQAEYDELGYPKVPEEWNEEWMRQQIAKERLDPRENPNLLVDDDQPEFWCNATRKPYARAMLRAEQHWSSRRNEWLRQYEEVETLNQSREMVAEFLETCSMDLKRLLTPIMQYKITEITLWHYMYEAREHRIPFRQLLQQPEKLTNLQGIRSKIDNGGSAAAAQMLEEYHGQMSMIMAAKKKKQEEENRGKRIVSDHQTVAKHLNQAEKCKKDGYIEWHKGNFEEALKSWREANEFLKEHRLPDIDKAGNQMVADMHIAVLKNVAQAAIKLGYWTEALTAADDALLIDRQDHKAWFRRACALEGLGRYDEEREALDKIEECAVGRPDRERIQKDVVLKREQLESTLERDREAQKCCMELAMSKRIFSADRHEMLPCSRREPSPEAPASAPIPKEYIPGVYVILKTTSVRSRVELSSPKTAELRAGKSVDVLEVVHSVRDGRFRGRVKQPKGWITLFDRQHRTQWAKRQVGPQEVELESSARPLDEQAQAGRRKRLTRDGAADLLDDLHRAYGDTFFQNQVGKLARDMVQDRESFIANLKKIALEVQRPILEKWGFEPSTDGVTEMQLAIHDHVRGGAQTALGSDPALEARATAATKLLHGEMYDALFDEKGRALPSAGSAPPSLLGR